jgi:hypothetical protein
VLVQCIEQVWKEHEEDTLFLVAQLRHERQLSPLVNIEHDSRTNLSIVLILAAVSH